MNPATCVILVPIFRYIEPECEACLRQLETRGYQVRRIYGFANIDLGRSCIATAALADGFQELMWIDADIAFDPTAVDRLRSHNLPAACAIYVQKGRRKLACQVTPEREEILFGQAGLVEIAYIGMGFMYTQRVVYDTMRTQLQLPLCNQQYGNPLVPYFLPQVVQEESGPRYLTEDFAFCRRILDCGLKIYADASIRLWHLGSYPYSWEDAGSDRPHYPTYQFKLTKVSPRKNPPPP